MKDPIGAFDSIKENFIRYVKTAFGTKFSGLERERYDLLHVDKVLYREPWVEPLPDYLSSGKKIENLGQEDLGNALSDAQVNTFKSLVHTGLVPASIKLHYHQAEMLREAISGNNCIITSGTGSGKTESFLLPLFAQLSKELSSWSRAGHQLPNTNNWWNELTPSQIVDARNDFKLSNAVHQRSHESRPSGVRALILYPMNALVEDQMSRLRKALDSNETRRLFASISNGNRIYFGRYNGLTPVAGDLRVQKDDGSFGINTNKVKELREALQQIEMSSRKVAEYVTANPGSDEKELNSFFQRLDGSEMRCRFDMQLSPPDILITNYSMLSIMLMRDVDAGVFEKTRAWLACEDLAESERSSERSNRIFHLIIDELHLYRGTQGTEVAYMLKLVLNRLGLNPHHPQLRILASSASLEANDPKSVKFLEDFFGIDNTIKPFKIITGRSNPIDRVRSKTKLPILPFCNIARVFENLSKNTQHDSFHRVCAESAIAIATLFELDVPPGNGIEQLLKVLKHDSLELRERFYAACESSGIHRAVCAIPSDEDNNQPDSFAGSIFADYENLDQLREALRGLLIARSLFDVDEYRSIEGSSVNKLPRFRFHYFFRNIEGIWASVKPNEVSVSYRDGQRTVGKLYPASRIRSEAGYRVLELLYCDNCGTTFFGGSRLTGTNNSFELLPISPNIEGIPEKTPAKLVEKRSYQEFAVFWPQGDQPLVPHDSPQGGWWRQTTINGHNQTDFTSRWNQASLNVYSGDVYFNFEKAATEPDKWIKGYIFTVISDDTNADVANWRDANGNLVESHRAIPSVCPGCGINHQKRQNNSSKSKTSPVRGFRTGFAKTTQMFAKELMYQLPEKNNERKLVVFSDSREDAAQIANGIERNHFTDLMREILVSELHSNLLLRNNIITAFDTNNQMRKDELQNSNREIYDEIEDLFDKSNYNGQNSIRQREQIEARRKLNEFRDRLINARELIDITNTLNLAPLIKRFVQLGINPGGTDISIQNRLLNNQFVPWYDLINFTDLEWSPGADLDFIRSIKEGAFTKLSTIFFGNLFYSFESSGLGFVSIDPNNEVVSLEARRVGIPLADFVQVSNGLVRILGDKYKHNHVEDTDPFSFTDYTRFPTQARNYVRSVAERYSLNADVLGNSLFDALTTSGLLRPDRGILIEELYIKIAVGTDSVWTSPRGSRSHLHFSGGVCTYSLTALHATPDKVCSDIWENNYLSYNAIIERRNPIRLHCEELTGQTDNQFERQRHFRSIILPDEGNPSVKEIDLLSVTTTLEVGVDIGALQAVMLANMPPQRFNYQQRVGRAGRRGQAYSAILTFCRGRSHDEFYFSNPQKITGDVPPTPFLTMGQLRIFKRLLAKEILRRTYLTIETNVNNDEDKPSVHGDFGKTDNWPSYRPQIEMWIAEHRPEIEQVIDVLLTRELREQRDHILTWVFNLTRSDSMMDKILAIIANDEISTNDISEKLAEGGILPMFGMPTTVKNLYHGINRNLQPLTIDRPQAMAIYEFAPGAQKTKDKAIHTSIGFTSDFIRRRSGPNETVTNASTANNLPFSLNRWMLRCKSCGFNHTYIVEPQDTVCPNCSNQNETTFSKFIIRTPRGYRTDLSAGSDSKDDSELLLSRPPIFAEKIEDLNNPDDHNQFGNADLILSDKDVTWRINTNSDKFYTGKLFTIHNRFPSGHHFAFNDQWLLTAFANNNSENGYEMRVNDVGEPEEQIALATNKKTEIFRVSPVQVPLELDLNMFSRDTDEMSIKAQSYGVRSGFYSAAFLLQRLLASRLDVDPTEIEIADIVLKSLDDGTSRRTAEIVLTDELPNGSGFVRYMYNNFGDILSEALNPQQALSYAGKIHSDEHRHNCNDACYECLKIYRNMNYHSLLDWRLGLSLLRVLSDANFRCGADGDFDSYPETNGWLQFATSLRDNFAASFGFDNPSDVNGLPIIRTGRNNRNTIVIVHPFWDFRDMKVTNWLSEIKAELEVHRSTSQGKIFTIDTFNLLRRPGWCYEKLITQ